MAFSTDSSFLTACFIASCRYAKKIKTRTTDTTHLFDIEFRSSSPIKNLLYFYFIYNTILRFTTFLRLSIADQTTTALLDRTIALNTIKLCHCSSPPANNKSFLLMTLTQNFPETLRWNNQNLYISPKLFRSYECSLYMQSKSKQNQPELIKELRKKERLFLHKHFFDRESHFLFLLLCGVSYSN